MPPVVVAAGVAAAGSVAGGVIAAGGAKSAGKTQAEAARTNQQNMLAAGQEAAKALAPWEQVGQDALAKYTTELGLSSEGIPSIPGVLSGQEIAEGFTADPGYQFRLSEGQRALEQSAAARGILRSGQTLGDIQGYAQGLASQEYGNYFNRSMALNQQNTNAYNQYMSRLAGLVDTGFNAAVSGANVKVGTASQAANANTQAANAIAQGQAGAANAWAGALGGIGQAAGTVMGYYSSQPQTPQYIANTSPTYNPASTTLSGTFGNQPVNTGSLSLYGSSAGSQGISGNTLPLPGGKW